MVTRNTRPTRKQDVRAVCAHCPHFAGAPFGMRGVGGLEVRGQLNVCCRCGRGVLQYAGIDEPGHGQFVLFDAAPIAPASGIVLPSGVSRSN